MLFSLLANLIGDHFKFHFTVNQANPASCIHPLNSTQEYFILSNYSFALQFPIPMSRSFLEERTQQKIENVTRTNQQFLYNSKDQPAYYLLQENRILSANANQVKWVLLHHYLKTIAWHAITTKKNPTHRTDHAVLNG